ncbi:nitrate reductase molybdenum cofactor assembly chaperone [uncultured Thalassospira sp.]|jgi:nitrate reductase delta subunit|uniref:nitrate reductase molybdenum cofactor assembly chaperone n=1 Tax=uncultured Thalassospira sp. TaxID=404382 RepID=UPI0030DC3584|tara:strand:+ start:17777 stop:18484 length:708 start_codon:yes stop_codon:yes gene_type:complete
MIMTFKVLSALLTYPGRELQDACAEIVPVLRNEKLLSPATISQIEPLLTELATSDIYDLQERFVTLFDRSRTLSLNLFEHVHGESRDRGGAMVDLLETYRAGGFEPATTELPDHLPVLLEFLATRPLNEGRETLADAAHILEALHDRLSRRDSPYAGVFQALNELALGETNKTALAELLAITEDDPDDLAALDAVWEESEVVFGPDPNGDCPQVRDILNRMDDRASPQHATTGLK